MLPRAVAAVVLALSLALSACGAGVSPEQLAVATAVTTANTTRLAIVTAETGALAVYRAAQLAEVSRVAAANGTREEAGAAVQAIRERWKPVWSALDTAQAAHAAVVAAIAAYEQNKGNVTDVANQVAALIAAEHAVADAIAATRGAR
jgi:hypothetical protein